MKALLFIIASPGLGSVSVLINRAHTFTALILNVDPFEDPAS